MKRTVIALVIGALALTGCGDSAEETLAAFCQSQDELISSVETARGLSAASTLEEVEAARDAIESAWDSYQSDAQDLSDVVVDAADGAYGRYVAAVDEIPDDATLAEAYGTVEVAVNDYFTELQAIAASVECP